MDSTNQPRIQWDQGIAFLQDGIIYCSPNASRLVLIPRKDQIQNNSPFAQPFIMANMYHQPVWWSDAYGWLAFIPLAPNYTSTPFEPFCWMPNVSRTEFHIKDGPSLSYAINEQDGEEWKRAERLLVDAAYLLRLWHHVPGTTPPQPSAQFRIYGPHKTSGVARKLIKLGRDWFGIWMGFLSYIIAQAKRPDNWADLMTPNPNIPVPSWYTKLLHDHSYTEDWLDGLMSSTVCQFDSKTPRAGIIYPFCEYDKTRPPIEWFLEHNIPVYYPWTAVEEDAVRRNPALRYLQPPQDLIHRALDELFVDPALPMAALVMREYYMHGENAKNPTLKALRVKYASSTVYLYINDKFYNERKRLEEYLEDVDKGKNQLKHILEAREIEQQKAARQGATLPSQGLVPALDRNSKGQLFEHVNSYIMRRHRRNKEIIAVEDHLSRARRLERQCNPPKVHTTMYQWTTIRSSGGVELYMRVRVPVEHQASAFALCDPTYRMYDSLNNEWDLYSEVQNAFENACVHATYPWQCEDDWSGGRGPVLNNDHYATEAEMDMHRCVNQTHHGDYLDLDVSGYGDDSLSSNSSPCRSPDIGPHYAQSPEAHPSSTTTLEPPHRQNRNAANIDRQQSQPQTGPSAMVDDVESTPMRVQSHLTSEVPEPRDMIRSLRFSYGYVPSLSTGPPVKIFNWESIYQNFGFNKHGGSSDIGIHDRDAISRFWAALCGDVDKEMPQDVSDLNDLNHHALNSLQDFRMIFRPLRNMFVFSEPRSDDCEWLLAVQTPIIALYVVRLLIVDRSHTIVSVAKELLSLGIPFRTLLPFSVTSASISGSSRFTSVMQPYSPTSFRPEGYVFTCNDYDAYVLQCRSILRQPQGRAALLKGGIVSRIAKQYLSLDQVLEGPSVEITTHRIGYIMDQTRRSGFVWCDDDLTADELATICGTYSIYTGRGDQQTIRSWFPPATFWADSNTSQMGCKWVEWTEKNESFFVNLVADIKAGRQQPLSTSVWKKKFRGVNIVRALTSNAQKRAQNFVDAHIPVREIRAHVRCSTPT